MMRKFLTTIAIIVSVCNIAFSQIEEASIGYIRFSKPYISKGELDISKNGTPFKFAEPIDVGINIADYAELNHDRGTISLTCQSDGAKSLNAILTILQVQAILSCLYQIKMISCLDHSLMMILPMDTYQLHISETY